jgi:pyrophosphatase PpaX
MIFDMMNRYGLTKSEVLKVGDTTADIQEGKNAGTYTAAILSGTQDEKEILKEQPDFVIRKLSELKTLI